MNAQSVRKTISRLQAKKMIENSGGLIFRAKFVKRTTGEIREMVCRLHVRKHLKGGPQAYQPADYGLVCVFDIQKEQYRSIPIDGLLAVTCRGDTFEVTD